MWVGWSVVVCASLSLSGALGTSVSIPTKKIAEDYSARDVLMPLISIGTGGLEHSDAGKITSTWLELGGRGIDAALVYRNQNSVAKVISQSGIPREDLFITTKIPGCDNASHNMQLNLQQFNVSYFDLVLIHFPYGSNCSDAWSTLEDYYYNGTSKAIGISNFERQNITSLMETARIRPHVHQIEYNVLMYNADQVEATIENNIMLEAYSPLGRGNHSGNIHDNSIIKTTASAHNVTVYQVAIKWILQNGHTLTFQSSNREHQASNVDVFDFNLTQDEMSKLNSLANLAQDEISKLDYLREKIVV